MKMKIYKKFRYLIALMFILMLSFCVGIFGGGNTVVLAKVNDDGTIDEGSHSFTKATQQGDIPVHSELGVYNMFVDGDAGSTQNMYTVKFLNLAGADPMVTTHSGGQMEFTNNVIHLKAGDSTKTSYRNPYASHSFKIPSNFVNAAQNGYLTISVSGGAKTVDTDDKIEFILYNGTLSDISTINQKKNSRSSGTNNKNEYVNQQVSLSTSDITETDFMVVFTATAGNNRGKIFGQNIGMYIEAPTLTISSTDSTAPSVTGEIDNEWCNASKSLKLHVSDSESGIQKVTCNGNEITKTSGNDKDNYYTIDVENNGEYNVEVVDNVGNTKTYIHNENHIDKSVPDAVSITGFPMEDTIYQGSVTFDVGEIVSDGLSEQNIYYTLDGTTPTTSSKTLTAGSMTLDFVPGEYKFRAMIIDGVGNCGQMYQKDFTIARRKITISTTNCSYALIKPTTLETDENLMCYDGEKLKFDFTFESGYERKKLLVNGQVMEFNSDTIEIDVNQDINVEVYYAFRITMLSFTKTYTYNPLISKQDLIYSFNTDQPLQYNISITKDGESAEPSEAGAYLFTWSYDSDTFVGSGTIEFEIEKLDVTLTVAEDQFKVYGDNDPKLVYKISGLPDGIDMHEVVEREQGENVGTYDILLKSHGLSVNNYNVSVNDQEFTIRQKKIVVVAESATKVYGDSDTELKYSLYNCNLIDGDSLSGQLERVAGEDVGVYDITLGTLHNSNYEILFLQGQFTITPKDIDITILPVTVTYGEEKPLTYTTSIEVSPDAITGSLEREAGNSVGDYEITIGSLSSVNYRLNVISATVYYKIVPKKITVTADTVSAVYGGQYTLTYVAEGLVGNDSLSGNLSLKQAVSGNLPVGSYEIVLGSIANPNYIVTFVKNYLTITPAKLTINIFDATQVYGKMEADLECEILGLVGDDRIDVRLYRVNGDMSDVGEYEITVAEMELENYEIDVVNTGTYTITKASITPVLPTSSIVYDGKVHTLQADSFPFELSIQYFQNGIECEGLLNAGEYLVVATFAGNNNYIESSTEVQVTVEKQKVYLTLGTTEFTYDGNVHWPDEFYYGENCGIDGDKFEYIFENDATPVECGEYPFSIKTSDPNYEVECSGVLKIASSFSVSNENESVVECEDATFDADAQDLVLVETSLNGKFNNQEILSSCTFENVSENDYVYTVKIKARAGVNKVYVYQLGENNSVRQMAVSLVDGYYVFKVDNLNDTYLITKDIDPVPLWFWVIVMASVILALVLTLLIVKYARRRIRAKKNTAEIANYNAN